MQVFNEKLGLANNSEISTTEGPCFTHRGDKYFEFFVEEYVRENLRDLVDDVLCGAI